MNQRKQGVRRTTHLAILASHLTLVAGLTVDEEEEQVDEIEVGQDRVELAGQRVGQRQGQVARVVDVPGEAPPATAQQLALGRLNH